MMLYILLLIPLTFVAHQAAVAIYNLYFHPLARAGFKGPKLWIAFPILRYIAHCRGTMDASIVLYHRKYGNVMRLGDNGLSFTTAQAWKDIYGYGHGSTQWPKKEFRPPGSVPNIIFSNDADHARFRRALAHAFSEKALAQQESLIKKYVDLLVEGLSEESRGGRSVDMTMWYNLTTFDIISDLAFGEPSNNIENKALGENIVTIFKFLQIVPVIMMMQFYPAVWKIVRFFIGKSTEKKRQDLFAIGRTAAMKRKADREKDGRADFMEFLLKHSEQKELITDEELGSNAHILFMAGSETTSTLLAGATYYLMRSPDTMAKAVREVRGAFEREEDITFSTASARLPYMLACLEEALRMYPPVPTIIGRITPAHEISRVAGHDIPPNTIIGVHQLATNYSTSNFTDPYTFKPERWMPGSSEYANDNRDARQPFSVGPRNCIGKNLAFSEMRQIPARTLWRFDLEMVDLGLEWEKQKSYTLWSKGPLDCEIRDRLQADDGATE